MQDWGLQLYSKRDSTTGVFLWILWNFQEHPFYRTLLDDCFYDCLRDIILFSLKNSSKFLCKILSITFLATVNKDMGLKFFSICLSLLFVCRSNLLFSIQEEIFHFEDMIQILTQMVCKERHHKVLPFESLSYHDHGLYLR